jgi:apolipoprotein D and lipocalin family protein
MPPTKPFAQTARIRCLAMVVTLLPLMTACQSSSTHGPIRTETNVDLERFMGDWYVIAAVPTFLETEAYNAIESYELQPDGRVATTFTFNKGGFDGPLKVYKPVGFVREGTGNAVWGMRFVWPVKAEYRIVYLDEGYNLTIIGRSKRDYVWIMARTAEIPEADYQKMLHIIEEEGYDTSKIRKVPQSP